jgi:hypothetical protein
MSDLHRSIVSSHNNKKVVTIQDSGLMVQYPGYFRGKPHFLPYAEISHSTVTQDDTVTIFLNKNRTLIFDGISKYECQALNLAIIEGAKGSLSKNEEYLTMSECNADQEEVFEKKNKREKLLWEVIAVVAFVIVCVAALIWGDDKSEPLPWETKEDTTLEENTSIYDDIDMDSDDSDDENSDDENSDDENSDDDSKDLFDQFLDIIKD